MATGFFCTPKIQIQIGGATHLTRDQKTGAKKIPAVRPGGVDSDSVKFICLRGVWYTAGLLPKNANLVLSYNRNDSDAKKRNRIVDKGGIAMNDCIIMEMHCLERARLDPLNRGKWIAQAERWHELARAQRSWRHQKRSPPTVNGRRSDGDANASAELAFTLIVERK